MSDPEVPQPEQPADVNDVVDSANAGLAEAEAAAAEVPGADTDGADIDGAAEGAAEGADAHVVGAESAGIDSVADAVDPDLAAFEEAERAHPGTFGAPESFASSASSEPSEAIDERATADADASIADSWPAADANDASIADTAYLPPAADDTATRVVPSEPVPQPSASSDSIVAAPPAFSQQQQPIFVQAPEPPRERNNRGTAAGIGLLATLSFAILYLATALGLGALAGDVTGENIGEAALAPLTTWGFWVPVVVFFIGFWLLGAIINRGRWGRWVVFGIIVGIFAYAGHILGQLFEAPFWAVTASEGSELVGSQLLAPLAIAAFVFGRELTIWFGAWAARSGARKTELNAEAQREYERTLEAGPSLPR
ncbi:ABC transporter [Microbacterium sp. A93]|uniref:ABC transporter n=1 Tax=Microbacterium sp. A93 TaxID=3450716 RepID=UPI003F4425FE